VNAVTQHPLSLVAAEQQSEARRPVLLVATLARTVLSTFPAAAARGRREHRSFATEADADCGLGSGPSPVLTWNERSVWTSTVVPSDFVTGWASSAASAWSRRSATSEHARASCSISTSRSWDESSEAPDRGSSAWRTGEAVRSAPTPPASVRQIAGWECVDVAIDDCTRLAYAEVLGDHRAPTVVAFLRRAIKFFARHAITVERVLTDNGSSYRGAVHALACRALRIRHLRTRPYRPQTNGKAERFIRTLISGWAYGAAYRNSHERAAALDGWLWYCNHQRKHAALGHKPPIACLNERTNLLGTYTYATVRRPGRPRSFYR
jgi:hypothetical protein